MRYRYWRFQFSHWTPPVRVCGRYRHRHPILSHRIQPARKGRYGYWRFQFIHNEPPPGLGQFALVIPPFSLDTTSSGLGRYRHRRFQFFRNGHHQPGPGGDTGIGDSNFRNGHHQFWSRGDTGTGDSTLLTEASARGRHGTGDSNSFSLDTTS